MKIFALLVKVNKDTDNFLQHLYRQSQHQRRYSGDQAPDGIWTPPHRLHYRADFPQSAQDRLAGYRMALESAGIDYDPTLVVEGAYGTWSHGAGYRGMKQLLGQADLTAIFAQNDHAAVGAMTAIREIGLGIPCDVSVVGYDDTSDAGCIAALTTVRQPTDRVGEESVRLLMRLIEDPGRSPFVILTTELIARGSVMRCWSWKPPERRLREGLEKKRTPGINSYPCFHMISCKEF
ncbi:MAG: substrate-binding domain-containing protein [Desulfobacterales bacterium]|nr:substrate-binding domain-containing protein [Desulfobacterales bacterium]